MKATRCVLTILAISVGIFGSAQDKKLAGTSESCVIVKRMGAADEVTSHLYSFGIRGKQYQYVEGNFPNGIKFHGRLTDNDVRKIMEKGGAIRIVEPKYTQEDLEGARKSCRDENAGPH